MKEVHAVDFERTFCMSIIVAPKLLFNSYFLVFSDFHQHIVKLILIKSILTSKVIKS